MCPEQCPTVLTDDILLTIREAAKSSFHLDVGKNKFLKKELKYRTQDKFSDAQLMK